MCRFHQGWRYFLNLFLKPDIWTHYSFCHKRIFSCNTGRTIYGIKGDKEAENIYIYGNKIYDSKSPGIEGCDQNQDKCATRQRHYILVKNVKDLWIENNHLSGGGRIKAGGPGQNIYIRDNIIDFVNDNGITIVDEGQKIVDKDGNNLCISVGMRNTQNIEISGNTIIDAVATGIFFGADGQKGDDPQFKTQNIYMTVPCQ